MPEYLAPGVFVEETSFRSKTIEGISTSTAGFVGPTRYGPVSGEPELLTSFADFERIYGGLDDLNFANGSGLSVNYLAHGVRTFFEEGGRRLYVMRVFNAEKGFDVQANIPQHHYAKLAIPDATANGKAGTDSTAPAPLAAGTGAGAATTGGKAGTGSTDSEPQFTIVARFPGAAGKMRITFRLTIGHNVLVVEKDAKQLTRVNDGDVVFVSAAASSGGSTGGVPATSGSSDPGDTGDTADTADTGGTASPTSATDSAKGISGSLHVVSWNKENNVHVLNDGTRKAVLSDFSGRQVFPFTVAVEIERPHAGDENYSDAEALGVYSFNLKNSLVRTFTRNPESRYDALTIPFAFEGVTSLGDSEAKRAIEMTKHLLKNDFSTLNSDKPPTGRHTLVGGDDGKMPMATEYAGKATGFLDYSGLPLQMAKNGLLAFEGVEDISIIAGPGYSARKGSEIDAVFAVEGALIDHCEKMKYRVAVLDTLPDTLPTDALMLRNQRSSKHAAIYYPWVIVADPRPGKSGKRLALPPSGFVTGIYARNDIEHAVFKAPANEVVRLAIDFQIRLNQGQQELLNPNAVNCFRFFEGRGFLLWGARTMTDDLEWKYINLRRYFAYLEYSIDRGTQWAVFENNGPQLWANVRQTIEDFLFNEWRSGGLLGDKPEQAYFVRCDRSTMTQNDLDNGRLVCLIGVAPVRPAEFVIFRIGQWTANSSRA